MCEGADTFVTQTDAAEAVRNDRCAMCWNALAENGCAPRKLFVLMCVYVRRQFRALQACLESAHPSLARRKGSVSGTVEK